MTDKIDWWSLKYNIDKYGILEALDYSPQIKEDMVVGLHLEMIAMHTSALLKRLERIVPEDE